MDLLDGIEVGAQLKGKIGAVFTAAGALLFVGWVYRWPVAHPLVQGILDERVQQMTEWLTASVNGSN